MKATQPIPLSSALSSPSAGGPNRASHAVAFRWLLSCLALGALVQTAHAVPFYSAASSTANTTVPEVQSGAAPVVVSTTGPGYGYSGATWTGSGSAEAGLLQVSLSGSGNPHPFNGAAVQTVTMASAIFSDAGGASHVSVSLNAVLDGFKTWTGNFSSEMGVNLSIGGNQFIGAVRNNQLGLVHAIGLLQGSTDQTFDNLLIATPFVTVATGSALTIEMALTTTDTLSGWGFASSHGGYSLGLLTGGPVFTLGTGVSVQLDDWSVVDNRFGSAAPSVPDGPVSAWLPVALLLLGHAGWQRRRAAGTAGLRL